VFNLRLPKSHLSDVSLLHLCTSRQVQGDPFNEVTTFCKISTSKFTAIEPIATADLSLRILQVPDATADLSLRILQVPVTNLGSDTSSFD